MARVKVWKTWDACVKEGKECELSIGEKGRRRRRRRKVMELLVEAARRYPKIDTYLCSLPRDSSSRLISPDQP